MTVTRENYQTYYEAVQNVYTIQDNAGAPSGGSIDLTSDEQQQVNTLIAAAWA